MANLTETLHILGLENAGEAKLKEKESLHKLVFEWSDGNAERQDESAQERVLEELQPHSNLKELQFVHYRGPELPSWVGNGLLKNLVTLSFKYCSKCRILSLYQLPHLGQLDIEGMGELEEWSDVEFPSLHALKISYCPKLRKLPFVFPQLEDLMIQGCDSLMALPVPPSLLYLALAHNSVLDDWNEVMVQRTTKSDGEQPVGQPSLYGLLELKLTHCPKLQALPIIKAARKLEISRCELLTSLLAPQYSQALQHLALDGFENGKLVGTIPETSSLQSLAISNISNLTCLPQWPCLPGLRTLEIRNCEDLESLGPKDALKCLPSLTDLHIDNCPKLHSFPEDGVPTSLQHLTIKGPTLLMERFREEKDEGGPDWPKITHIPGLDITMLDAKPKSSGSRSSSRRRYHVFSCCQGIELNESNQEEI